MRLSRKAPAKLPLGTRSLERRREHQVALRHVERADEDPQLQALCGVLLGQCDGAPLVNRNGNQDVVRKGAVVFRATSVSGEMSEGDAWRHASMAIHRCKNYWKDKKWGKSWLLGLTASEQTAVVRTFEIVGILRRCVCHAVSGLLEGKQLGN